MSVIKMYRKDEMVNLACLLKESLNGAFTANVKDLSSDLVTSAEPLLGHLEFRLIGRIDYDRSTLCQGSLGYGKPEAR
jgi:hypothetical protein